ncbi:MAG: hypothetical protein Q9220_001530 [cf. Caloplaca sp. 1 TL-2023]
MAGLKRRADSEDDANIDPNKALGPTRDTASGQSTGSKKAVRRSAQSSTRSSESKTLEFTVENPRKALTSLPRKLPGRQSLPHAAKAQTGSPTAIVSSADAEKRSGSRSSKMSIHSLLNHDVVALYEPAKATKPYEPCYWLMKAENRDVGTVNEDRSSFSMQKLKDSTQPQAWEGVLSPETVGKMRDMEKGDLAFLYQDKRKNPSVQGILGILEITRDPSPDSKRPNVLRNLVWLATYTCMAVLVIWSNHRLPYYDKSSIFTNRSHQVEVELRQEFPKMLTVEEIQKSDIAKRGLRLLKYIHYRPEIDNLKKIEWEHIKKLGARGDGSTLQGPEEGTQNPEEGTQKASQPHEIGCRTD